MPNGAEVAPAFFDVVVTDPAATHTRLRARRTTRSRPPTTPSACMRRAWWPTAARCRSASVRWVTRSRRRLSCATATATSSGASCESSARTASPTVKSGASTRACMAARRCSSTASCKLIEAGIIRREVFADTVLQQLINDGRIARVAVTPADTARAARCAVACARRCAAQDLAFLQRFGILRPEVRIEGE